MKKIMRYGRVAVAVLLLAVVAAGLLCFVSSLNAEPVDQYHSGWKLIRETADEDGATFAVVYDLSLQSNFANKDSSTVANGGAYQIRSYIGTGIGTEFQASGNVWQFVICGKNYDIGADNVVDNTFSFSLIGWARINGMLQVIADGSGVLGNQTVITFPDDGADAVGALVDETAVTYTHSTTTFSKTGIGADVVVGMMVYVTGTNLTDGFYAVTSRTSGTIVCSGITSANNNTDSTVKSNPAFWADSITLGETTKWVSNLDGSTAASGNKGTLAILNHADNEVAVIVVDLSGIEWIQFVIYDALAGQSGEAGDITVYGRPYN